MMNACAGSGGSVGLALSVVEGVAGMDVAIIFGVEVTAGVVAAALGVFGIAVGTSPTGLITFFT